MSDRRLEQLRARLVGLLRLDPPVRGSPVALDRWLLTRLSRDEIELLLRAEREYGDRAVSDWLGEILVEAGIATPRLRLVG